MSPAMRGVNGEYDETVCGSGFASQLVTKQFLTSLSVCRPYLDASTKVFDVVRGDYTRWSAMVTGTLIQT